MMDRQVSSSFTEIDLEAVAPILEGKLGSLPPISSRLVRVFVSSTFSGRHFAFSIRTEKHLRFLLVMSAMRFDAILGMFEGKICYVGFAATAVSWCYG